MAKYYVYLIKSEKQIYIGHTADLEKRIAQHNKGQSAATRRSKVWELIYSEEYSSRALAMKRESFLKTGDGRQVLRYKNVIKF